MSRNSLSVQCTKGEVEIFGRLYVMYSGFMTPNDLIKFCDVPSFPHAATHVDIANNLTKNPVKDWQRPINKSRLETIRANVDQAISKNPSKDTLMANPVFIGRSDQIATAHTENGASVSAKPFTMQYVHTDNSKINIPVPGIFNIGMKKGSRGEKPLWILDGQHRIHGLGQSPFPENSQGHHIQNNASIMADQVIPVVFVIEKNYTPQFLAKIFTEVTTEAEKMSNIHEDWMQYAFRMKPYDNSTTADAMGVVIELCNTQIVDHESNPFYSSIQFNPIRKEYGVGTLKFNSYEWRELFENHYFERIGPTVQKKTSSEIVETFVKFYRACVGLDWRHKTGKSKILSTPGKRGEGGSRFLAKHFFAAFLEYLALKEDAFSYTKDEWIDFLCTEERNYQHCDWILDRISPGAMETNSARTASKKAAKLAFQRFFRKPLLFEGEDIVTYMFGPDEFEYRTAESGTKFPSATSKGKFISKKATGDDSTLKINLREHGHGQLKFVNLKDSLSTIVELRIKDNNGPEKKITAGNVQNCIKFNVGPTKRKAEILLKTLCLSDDSEKTLNVQVIY